MEKITLHRALAELKLLDSKIEKGIDTLQPTALIQNGKLTTGNVTKEEFEKNAKGKLQSVTDLIRRKTIIKSAIVTANEKTTFTVAGLKTTIAQAIVRKSIIEFEKQLKTSVSQKQQHSLAEMNRTNENVKVTALNNAQIMLGRQGDANFKPTDDDVQAIMEPFIKRNELTLLDPLKATEFTETIGNAIEDFEMEVDAALSEVNATTFIEIE